MIRSPETITGELEALGASFDMGGEPSQGRFSLVEHPIVPRGLASAMHVQAREDQYSFVLQGRRGPQLKPAVDRAVTEHGGSRKTIDNRLAKASS